MTDRSTSPFQLKLFVSLFCFPFSHFSHHYLQKIQQKLSCFNPASAVPPEHHRNITPTIPPITSEDNQEYRDAPTGIAERPLREHSGSCAITFGVSAVEGLPEIKPAVGMIQILPAPEEPMGHPRLNLGNNSGDLTCKSAILSRNPPMSPASRRWKLVKNTVKAVGQFQTTHVQALLNAVLIFFDCSHDFRKHTPKTGRRIKRDRVVCIKPFT